MVPSLPRHHSTATFNAVSKHIKNFVADCGLSDMMIAEFCNEKDAETGVAVRHYDPHVFQTNDRQKWAYRSCFTGWHLLMKRISP